MNFKIGDRVVVNIYKSGYWTNCRAGTVTKVTAKRVRVKTVLNEAYYSPRSIRRSRCVR